MAALIRWAVAAGALALAAAVSGCASAPESKRSESETFVVVVPGDKGHVGAVVVNPGPEEKVLDTAYASARADSAGEVRVGTASETEVKAAFGAARTALPQRPVTFMVNFVLATDRLTEESGTRLKDIADEVSRREVADIRVEGHTDRKGTDENNLALSRRRAERVREYLVQSGLDAGIIHAVGLGEREPLVPTEDEVAEPRNRRVEIIVR